MTERMAIVPLPITDEMVEVAIAANTYSEAVERAIAASPNAGKVSREKFIECANMLMGRVNAPQSAIFDAAREFITALGLEIEE